MSASATGDVRPMGMQPVTDDFEYRNEDEFYAQAAERDLKHRNEKYGKAIVGILALGALAGLALIIAHAAGAKTMGQGRVSTLILGRYLCATFCGLLVVGGMVARAVAYLQHRKGQLPQPSGEDLEVDKTLPKKVDGTDLSGDLYQEAVYETTEKNTRTDREGSRSITTDDGIPHTPRLTKVDEGAEARMSMKDPNLKDPSTLPPLQDL